MDLILAFSLQDQVEKYGTYVGLAAFLGLAVLSLLYFAQARELKRLRDWAGRAPERAQELEARVVAQAEEALREAESGAVGPAVPAAAASGNGGQVAAPAAIPMGPRPAVAAAAARAQAAQATVEAPVVPAVTEGDGPPRRTSARSWWRATPRRRCRVRPRAASARAWWRVPREAGDEAEAAAPGETAADDQAAPADDGERTGARRATTRRLRRARPRPMIGPRRPTTIMRRCRRPTMDGRVAGRGSGRAVGRRSCDRAGGTGSRGRSARSRTAPPKTRTASPRLSPHDPATAFPAAPPAQIPRATPRPQPRPAAAPLRASTPSRPVTVPPRRPAPGRSREGGSRVGLYTALGILVLAAAIFVPVYFMVLADDEEPAPQPNPIAEPGADPETGGAGAQASEARSETVVVVLNGTPVDGLASEERDELVAAGYSDEQGMLRIDNNPDQQCQDSIVYYSADERRQARDVSRLLDITRTEEIDEETQALADSSDQSGTLPADVVALLCADKSP